MTLNAMSSTLPSSGKIPLDFYIVPAKWFSKAYPILTARTHEGISDTWKEDIGRISNLELMNMVERESSSDDEETNTSPRITVSDLQKKRFELMHRRIGETQQQQSTMKPGLIHARDFFFLGPGAWALVKEKFDFDGYELVRPVVLNPQSTLAIQLLQEESDGDTATLIDIPASGRFPYERITTKFDSTTTTTTALVIVPEEEDGHNEVRRILDRLPFEVYDDGDDVLTIFVDLVIRNVRSSTVGSPKSPGRRSTR